MTRLLRYCSLPLLALWLGVGGPSNAQPRTAPASLDKPVARSADRTFAPASPRPGERLLRITEGGQIAVDLTAGADGQGLARLYVRDYWTGAWTRLETAFAAAGVEALASKVAALPDAPDRQCTYDSVLTLAEADRTLNRYPQACQDEAFNTVADQIYREALRAFPACSDIAPRRNVPVHSRLEQCVRLDGAREVAVEILNQVETARGEAMDRSGLFMDLAPVLANEADAATEYRTFWGNEDLRWLAPSAVLEMGGRTVVGRDAIGRRLRSLTRGEPPRTTAGVFSGLSPTTALEKVDVHYTTAGPLCRQRRRLAASERRWLKTADGWRVDRWTIGPVRDIGWADRSSACGRTP